MTGSCVVLENPTPTAVVVNAATNDVDVSAERLPGLVVVVVVLMTVAFWVVLDVLDAGGG
jgi:hypothetical protein